MTRWSGGNTYDFIDSRLPDSVRPSAELGELGEGADSSPMRAALVEDIVGGRPGSTRRKEASAGGSCSGMVRAVLVGVEGSELEGERGEVLNWRSQVRAPPELCQLSTASGDVE